MARRVHKSTTVIATDAKSCSLCKSAKGETMCLDCRQHSICKECLQREAAKNANRMFDCLACSIYTAAAPSPTPVFVDHDNLLLEAQKLGGKCFDSDKDDRIRIDYKKFGDIIARGERNVEGKVYNCRDVRINDKRFVLMKADNSFHTGMQKQIDTTICVDITAMALTQKQNHSAYPTIVLVSGDRDILPALQKALEAGWGVEIYMWEHNTAKGLKELAENNEKCSYIPLDEHFEEIIYRHYFTFKEDEDSSVVLTVSRGKFGKDERVYQTHECWWKELEEISRWPVQYKWLEEVKLSKLPPYELKEPRLLLVFNGLGLVKTKMLLSKIPSFDKDGPHERSCEMYAKFKVRLEQGRSASASLTPTSEWSQVVSKRSTPRSTPTNTECCSGKNCKHGSDCTYYHSIDDKSYFKTRYGKGHFRRKTSLCPRHPSHSLPEKCDFAHGPKDGWCTKCHKKGHFRLTCRNSECNHPKHTAEKASHALRESYDTTPRAALSHSSNDKSVS